MLKIQIKLNYHSSEPLFQQAVLQIKRLVVTKQLKEGEKLPSIRVLAKELQLNPTTVVRVFNQLAAEGVVVQRPGVGMFVSENDLPFSEEFIQKELKHKALVFLVEGLRYGKKYPELKKIIDDQYKEMSSG